ncbi:MAG: hypothetical protein DCC73_15050 [Proteobacteria bacterium]|nr:MAG: hypothetical protein DCC73_15050 [Pseudomonadota bacterium]
MPTYPITLPTAGLYAEWLRLTRIQAAMPSPFSGAFQGVDKFAQWMLTINLTRMSFANAEIMAAAVDSLRGQIGTFSYAPWQSQTSALTGRTLAVTLYKYSSAAQIAGWTASAASQLRAGQFLQIGNQLFRLTAAPANADGAGKCTVEFEPYARQDYAAATAVEFAAPKGLFRLLPDAPSGFEVDVHRYPAFKPIEAVEAL